VKRKRIIDYKRVCLWALSIVVLALLSVAVSAQRKTRKKTAPPAPKQSELAKLRDEFVSATKDYKASLEKLLAIYEGNVKKAEEKLELSKKLLAEGLIAKTQVQDNERALAAEKEKVADTHRQMTNADAQIAGVLVEAEADEQISKDLRLARQSLVRTSAFTRFNGSPGWGLTEAWKVQRFFSDTFHKPLPIAVFGQGAIHERWRLDHRNAMDISLHPDTAEGRALLDFLQKNGIPYLAFRSAIPGTATGPHIHIGRPSHRY
jgi:ribosome-binding protein aMBF1 (putative translation factor)